MQLLKAPDAEKMPFIEASLQSERIARYMTAAGQNKSNAFALYIWNCALCESFYTTIHFSEIVVRNAISKRMVNRLTVNWYKHSTFRGILDARYLEELDRAIADEQAQHGAKMTSHHIVSALTFGFWQHMLTKRFTRLFWEPSIKNAFPNAPNHIDREAIHSVIESVRHWRNRIAHHRAIFDKGPMAKHQEALNLIKWVCLETGDWVSSVSTVPLALAARPKAHEPAPTTPVARFPAGLP